MNTEPDPQASNARKQPGSPLLWATEDQKISQRVAVTASGEKGAAYVILGPGKQRGAELRRDLQRKISNILEITLSLS